MTVLDLAMRILKANPDARVKPVKRTRALMAEARRFTNADDYRKRLSVCCARGAASASAFLCDDADAGPEVPAGSIICLDVARVLLGDALDYRLANILLMRYPPLLLSRARDVPGRFSILGARGFERHECLTLLLF